MARPSLNEEPMTGAQRKARQRQADALRQTASAERIDAAIVKVFKEQCRSLGEGMARRPPDLNELVHLVARQFSLHERPKVFERLGLEFVQPKRLVT